MLTNPQYLKQHSPTYRKGKEGYDYIIRGSVANGCNFSLSKMRNQLESVLTALNKIIISVLHYENTDLIVGNQSENAFVAQLRVVENSGGRGGNVSTSLLGVLTNGSSS